MAFITIGEPVGETITVEIKDSDGDTVFGPSSETAGTPFDIGSLASGDYTVYVTLNGATNGYCFTVSSCECPTLDDVRIEMGTSPIFFGYLFLDFDMTAGFSCPFIISFSVDGGTPISVPINSLADFTSNVGDIYTRQLWIGGFALNVTYAITLPPSGGSLLTVCVPATTISTGACVDPDLISLFPTGPIKLFGTGYTPGPPPGFRVVYNAVGCIEANCTTATINYLQINGGIVGAPDSGTIVGYDLCSANYFPVNPNLSYPAYNPASPGGTGRPSYTITVTTCCGAVYSGIAV